MEDALQCEIVRPTPRSKEEKITTLVVISSVIASIGGILFGYDIGIVSTALLQLRSTFTLSCTEQEFVVTSVVLGAFVGSLLAGSVVDRFGRRRSILGTSLLFVMGSVLTAGSQNLIMLLISRLIVGFGVALSTAAECTYISEIAPKKWRGMLVSLNELGITVGFLLSFLVGHFLVSVDNGWRYMFGLAAAPGLFQLVGVSCLPPSPYYLILRGNPIKAEEILKKIQPGIEPQQAVEEITSAVLEAKCTGMRQLFGSKDNMRVRMLIGLSLALLQQLTGNSNVLYYAPTIFQQFGYCSDSASTQASIYLGVVKVITAVLALLIIDKLGRRVLLSYGALTMGISVIALGVITVTSDVVPPVDHCSRLYVAPNESVTLPTTTDYGTTDWPDTINTSYGYFVKFGLPYQPEISETVENISVTTEVSVPLSSSIKSCTGTQGPVWFRTLSIILLMIYISAYQFSFGIGTWIVLSEIFPTKVRGRCVGISTSAYWLANVVLSVTFLDTVDGMGIGYTMILYGAICILAFLLIFLFLPETKQKTLEEISADFNKGFRLQMTFTSARQPRGIPRNGLEVPRLQRQGSKGPVTETTSPRPASPTVTPTSLRTNPRPASPKVTSTTLRTNGAFRTLHSD